MPTRSAWPGLGLVSGSFRAWPASSSSATGSADMTVAHLGHSVLPMRMATGPPSVRPCLTPPVSSASSCSNFIRAPRPYPARRRASAAATSAVVISTPAGTPSQIATSAWPCDSPAVNQRSMKPILPRPPEFPLRRQLGYVVVGAQPDRDAAPETAAEARHHSVSYVRAELGYVALVVGCRLAGQHQDDRQVVAAIVGLELERGHIELTGEHSRHDLLHIGVCERFWCRFAAGERGEPGTFHGERHRAG